MDKVNAFLIKVVKQELVVERINDKERAICWEWAEWEMIHDINAVNIHIGITLSHFQAIATRTTTDIE